MLNNLKNHSPEAIERHLASLIQRLLPHPGIEPSEAEPGDVKELQDSLLAEIRERFNLDPADQSQTAQAKLFKFLVEEMSEPVMKGAREKQAKARLGQNGNLRSDLYRIKFGDSFHANEVTGGIRRSHVEEALRHPNQVQHLLPERFGLGEDTLAVSIYAKHNEKFILLVQTTRKGDTQLVGSAWRVYHSDVDLSAAYEPLEMLRAFADVYGMYFRVGHSAPAKFFLYEVVPMLKGKQPVNIITIDNPTKEACYVNTLLRESNLQVWEVAIAYVINTSRYISDLRNHKVHISSGK